MHRRHIASTIATLALVASSCVPVTPGTRTGAAPAPPIDPTLKAVLIPGSPPRFARGLPTGRAYEVLPASSVYLRMKNAMPPQPENTEITLRLRSGVTPPPLAYVRSDDQSRQRALDADGYFSVQIDGFGYTLVITPPAAERRGPGFELVVRNKAPNPPAGSSDMSVPLQVSIVPVSSRTLPSEVFFDCGQDGGGAFHNCKPGASVVVRNFTMEGRLTGLGDNAFSNMAEDFAYYIIPDADFIEEYYGELGMMRALSGATPYARMKFRGNPAQPVSASLPVQDVFTAQTTERGMTINSVTLPWQVFHPVAPDTLELIELKGELNGWHVADMAGGGRRFISRGPEPAGWLNPLNVRQVMPPTTVGWSDTRWPWDPWAPEGPLPPLAPGMCVRITGALYIDSAHGDDVTPVNPPPWERAFPGYGGWAEIHPPDWIQRVDCRERLKTPILVKALGSEALTARFKVRPIDTRAAQTDTLAVREVIDGRFTTAFARTTTRHIGDTIVVDITMGSPRDRYKATWLAWWEPVR